MSELLTEIALAKPTRKQITRRMWQWLGGVVVISLLAVCAPLLVEVSREGHTLPFARLFGSTEFVLTGIVIMAGGVAELYGRRVRLEREDVKGKILLWSNFMTLVALFTYAGRYYVSTEQKVDAVRNATSLASAKQALAAAEISPGSLTLTLCTVVFFMSIACGTTAVLTAMGV